jgi:hypothetical protein
MDLKEYGTAEFGKSKKKDNTPENMGKTKMMTLRSKHEEGFTSKLMEDSKQEPIKQEDRPPSR